MAETQVVCVPRCFGGWGREGGKGLILWVRYVELPSMCGLTLCVTEGTGPLLHGKKPINTLSPVVSKRCTAFCFQSTRCVPQSMLCIGLSDEGNIRP